MAAAEDEITTLYAEIRGLIVRSAGEPGLGGEIDRLTERLRELQEQEANAMEKRFRAQLRVQPETVLELLARAERLVE